MNAHQIFETLPVDEKYENMRFGELSYEHLIALLQSRSISRVQIHAGVCGLLQVDRKKVLSNVTDRGVIHHRMADADNSNFRMRVGMSRHNDSRDGRRTTYTVSLATEFVYDKSDGKTYVIDC